MTQFLERRIPAALYPPLAQALILVYGRHVAEPEFCRALRELAPAEPELLRQFDALDALHAEFPFGRLSRLSLLEELKLLYWHNRQLGEAAMLAQLRALCQARPEAIEAFDRLDGEP